MRRPGARVLFQKRVKKNKKTSRIAINSRQNIEKIYNLGIKWIKRRNNLKKKAIAILFFITAFSVFGQSGSILSLDEAIKNSTLKNSKRS